jgi:PAS domain S-box-containing protein
MYTPLQLQLNIGMFDPVVIAQIAALLTTTPAAGQLTVEQLVAQIELHNLLLDSVPDTFWFKGPDLRYRVVNQAFCQFHDCTRDAILGRTSEEVLPAHVALGIRVSDQWAIEQRQLYQREMRLEYEPGVPIWIETNKQALFTADGAFLGIIGTMRETTERHATEEALRASEQRYRRLVQSLPDTTTILVDHQLRWLLGDGANRDLFCLPGAHAVGAELAQVLQADLVPAILPLLAAGLQHQEIEQRVDFAQRTLHVQVQPLTLDDAGKPGLLLVLHDITERVRAEEARLHMERTLQESQRKESLGLLAGGIAHDFNNLLTGILGYAELALLETDPDEDRHEYLHQIMNGAQYAAKLASQLLAYAGRGRYIVQPIDLNALVRAMTELIRVSLPKAVTITYDFDPDLPQIEGDPAQIQQVVLNLLTNAADALGGESGTVVLRTAYGRSATGTLPTTPAQVQFGTMMSDDAVLLEVRDTGCGMDAQTISSIFEPFFSTKQTGRGLGLAAVRGIVQGHQGQMEVCSTPGQGTTFRVWWPASMRPNEPSGPTPTQILRGGQALIIDDEADVRAVLRKMLERLHYRVYEADHGDAGVRQVIEYGDQLTVVLIDRMMPGVHGDTVARLIHSRNPHLPLILMSGYHTDMIDPEQADLQHLVFLAKPFTLDQLRSALQSAFQWRG